MKIAFLTTDNREPYKDHANPQPWFGTAPEALLQGFAHLPDAQVHVISCLRQPVVSPAKLADNVWYHNLIVPKWQWMTTGFQGCIRAVRRKLCELRPDIVHGQGTEREAALCAVFSGFPNVVTIHGNMAELARLFRPKIGSYNWLAARLEDFTLPRTAGVFCNSAYTESLVRPRARKTWRVANPIRLDFFKPITRAERNRVPVLLNIGHVVPRKRQVELLALAQRLHERGCRFEMRFVGQCGEHEYGQAFRRKVAEAAAQGYASYVGTKNTQELITCLDAADGLCHFPTEEAFGLVVAEAMARELKFFGTKLGGMLDICPGVPGAELVDVNDWGGLADAIERWVASGFPHADGAAAAMRVRYHPDVIAARHLEIYREVLSTGRTHLNPTNNG
jgi:glycosyltransferase involved in cell wall biosynthesis